MELHTRSYRKLFSVFLFLAPAAAVIRLLILFLTVDPATGFFRSSPALCTVFNAVLLLILFAMVLYGYFLARKKPDEPLPVPAKKPEEPDGDAFLLQQEEEEEEAESQPDDPAYLHGAGEIAMTWKGTLSAFASYLLPLAFFASAFAVIPKADSTLRTIWAILEILGALAMFLAALRASAKKSPLYSWLLTAPVFLYAVRMVADYRDLDLTKNKSLYIGTFLFVLTAILFFTYQAELSFGHPGFCHPDLYAHLALLTAFLGAAVLLPQFIAVFAGDFSLDPTELATLLTDLATAFYAGVKAFLLTREN